MAAAIGPDMDTMKTLTTSTWLCAHLILLMLFIPVSAVAEDGGGILVMSRDGRPIFRRTGGPETGVTDLVAKVMRTVVTIRVQGHEPRSGSGIVISSDGYVVTNYHVVRMAYLPEISVPGIERPFGGELVAFDPELDLALLKIDAENLYPATFWDSDRVRVGEPIVIIGNPENFDHSVSNGYVSATGRVSADRLLDTMIQTNAPINAGNSGGPVFNAAGLVIGVVTSAHQSQGINFAIPSNVVRVFVEQALRENRIPSIRCAGGWLGVEYTQAGDDPRFRDSGDLRDKALVTSLVAGGAAQRAGMKVDDVIISYDIVPDCWTGAPGRGTPVTYPQFARKVRMTMPCTYARIRVRRNDGLHELCTMVEERPPRSIDGLLEMSVFTCATLRDENLRERSLGEITGRYRSGLMVSYVENSGYADVAGLAEHDVILEANRRNLSTPEEFAEMLGNMAPGDAVLLKILRDGQYKYVVFEVPRPVDCRADRPE